MRVMIVGSNGQLGRDMEIICRNAGYDVLGIDVPQIDITDRKKTRLIIREAGPEIIINCAAYTAVDDCEQNRDLAFSVNRDGIANIACSAKEIKAPVVHISTDYVFDGLKSEPYVETDKTGPKSVYGMSKLAGEEMLCKTIEEHFIFRISWLYGWHGNNFVKTIRRIATQKQGTGEAIKVVNDQFGTPTYSVDVCRQILYIISKEQFGLYHCTSEGECSWYEFACHILKKCNIDSDILPCTTAEFPRPAPRPPYSVLENQRLKQIGMNIMDDWKMGFDAFLSEESAKTTAETA